ncbi:MAG: nucleotidyltransferase family protein [Gammaproteobacteria bacterium]|nr:nucleotidyltransferase family protein [Gammaproteobacteria bacterium]NNC96888.1 nucleotidyltransferase family protein [Gammaproteobacteria bacterium]NNM14000.1 nucleotidyltransferase family protein [Gammaproteobacteria bacterium]
MRAMILAAGRGVRLSPLTDTKPKPLIRVGEKCLIEYQIEALHKAGIQDIVINTGWLGQQLIDHLGSGSRYKVNLEYSIEPESGLETGGGIYQALPLLGNKPFIVVNADIFHQFDLEGLGHDLDADTLAHLVLVENPSFNPGGDFCMLENKVFLKDPALPDSHDHADKKSYTFSGIGVYRPELFIELRPGKFPLAPLLKAAIRRARVTGEFTAARWFDAGTESRIAEIERFIR